MALKFISKRKPQSETGVTAQEPGPSPNTINGLVALDIVVSPSGMAIFIYKSNQLLVDVLLDSIQNWDVSNNILRIYSLDASPLMLEFTSATEANNALIIIENALNS